MKPALLLRIASVITFLLGAGHTSGIPWVVDETAPGLALVKEMKDFHFDVLGFTRSYFDFYVGFGLTCSVCLFAIAVLLWQLGTISNTAPQQARPMVAVIFAAFVGLTVLDCLYFFTVPLVFVIAVAVCLALALIASGRVQNG